MLDEFRVIQGPSQLPEKLGGGLLRSSQRLIIYTRLCTHLPARGGDSDAELSVRSGERPRQ